MGGGLRSQRQGNRKQHSRFGKQQADSCRSLKVRGDSGRRKTLALFLFFLKIIHSNRMDASSEY